MTSDGEDDLTLKRRNIESINLTTREWKNSLESLLDNEPIPNSDHGPEELTSRAKLSSVDNLHMKPPASISLADGRTTSSSKTSSLGSSKGTLSHFHLYIGHKFSKITYICIDT